jgi:hypothetical protein
MTPFPVLHAPEGCPKFVNWDKLNEHWAQRNHGQSLQRLAERGGLSTWELYINVHGMQWPNRHLPCTEEQALTLVKSIAC